MESHTRARALLLLLLMLGAEWPCSSLRPPPRVVIVPGFLYGAGNYEGMCRRMREQGVDAMVAPIAAWHWIPVLGGRSVRPILERIDFAVDFAADCDAAAGGKMPWPQYSFGDLLADFWNTPGGVLRAGGTSDPEQFPDVEPRGGFFADAKGARPFAMQGAQRERRNVALVAHSAAGWICRIYVSSEAYAGRAYRGGDKVSALVALGSPFAAAPGVAFENVVKAKRMAVDASLPILAVAGKGAVGAEAGEFTRNSYTFCGVDAQDMGDADGDGVTPLSASLDLEGAEHLILDGITTHAPGYPALIAPELAQSRKNGTPWYGDEERLRHWLSWLLRHAE